MSASDLADVLEKVQLGTARNVVIPAEERRRTAYHEGHALLGMLQPGADPVRKVSIIPRGRALGVTLATPQQDRSGYDAVYLKGRMIGALGGIAAEELVLGVASTGAESDLLHGDRPLDGRPLGHVRARRARVGLPARGRPADARRLGRHARRRRRRAPEARRRVPPGGDLAPHPERGRLDAIAKGLLEHETLDEADVYAAAGVAHEVPVAAKAAVHA